MNKIMKDLWNSIFEPLSELTIYLIVAFIIQKIFAVTYIQGISIVFIFFLLSLLRDALTALVRGR